jgi:hypothetical protein
MCQVWRLLAEEHGGIPQGVIILWHPKLEEKGFNWAPRTFLFDASNDGLAMVLRKGKWTTPELGRLTPDGLCVRFPGYRLIRRPFHGLAKNPPRFLVPFEFSKTLLRFKVDDGKFYYLGRYSTDPSQVARTQSFQMASAPRARTLSCWHGDWVMIRTTSVVRSQNASSQGVEGMHHVLYAEPKAHLFFGRLEHASSDTNLMFEAAERMVAKLVGDPIASKMLGVGEDEASNEYRVAHEALISKVRAGCRRGTGK